jgi:hypothetical protein
MVSMAMLEKHMIDLLDAIEDSYEKARYMPCLVLLYSGIDVVASLEPSKGTGVGDRFKKWVMRGSGSSQGCGQFEELCHFRYGGQA